MHELLLVEDHPLLRAATKLALQHEGFVVHATGSADEALALLKGHPAIAAAILEIELDGAGSVGFTIASAARGQRPDLAVVFLTGRADLLVRRVPTPREVHLVKPCPIPQVAAAIRRMLR